MDFILSNTLPLVDYLTGCRCSFALYRLPYARACSLALQTSGGVPPAGGADELGSRPAFAMLPFDAGSAAMAVTVGADVCATGAAAIDSALRSVAPEPLPARSLALPDGGTTTRSDYGRAFDTVMRHLQSGEVRKIVLSRRRTIRRQVSPAAMFERACRRYPRTMVYLCHTPEAGTWIGCSPEIILDGTEAGWHTVALAGTMTADEASHRVWSGKNIEEQAIVTEYLRGRIAGIGTIVTQSRPFTVRAGQLVHIKTEIAFAAPGHSIADIVATLHPTPAVCGLPREAALGIIGRAEGYDRSYYSCLVGPAGIDGQTHLYVNLRCARIGADALTLYAGGGILATSDVEAEWHETEEKMNTILSII